MSNLYTSVGLPNKIKIDCSNRSKESAQGTKVYLNDTELHGVQEINFTASVDGLPCATITLVADVECLAPKENDDEICN